MRIWNLWFVSSSLQVQIEKMELAETIWHAHKTHNGVDQMQLVKMCKSLISLIWCKYEV